MQMVTKVNTKWELTKDFNISKYCLIANYLESNNLILLYKIILQILA